jgi:hypothetical protein
LSAIQEREKSISTLTSLYTAVLAKIMPPEDAASLEHASYTALLRLFHDTIILLHQLRTTASLAVMNDYYTRLHDLLQAFGALPFDFFFPPRLSFFLSAVICEHTTDS